METGAENNGVTTCTNDIEVFHKKQRVFPKDNHVLFSCFDDPEHLVEVNLGLIESFQCRIASVVRHTDPCELPNGKKFWRSGMTRGMLITMVKSLTLGEIVLSNGILIGEALVTLEYEGVFIGNATQTKILETPRMGVGFKKSHDAARHVLFALCGKIADAILQWPRLETAMQASLPYHSMSLFVGGRSQTPRYGANLSVTSDRAWVRFADRPKSDCGDGKTLQNVVNKLIWSNPRWLSETIIALGVVHYKLSCKIEDADFAKARDEKSFKRLRQEIENDPIGSFFCVRMDMCKASCDSKTRKELNKGERFYNEMRNTIVEFTRETSSESKIWPNQGVQYERAIVTFVESLVNCVPVCARDFSVACSDENGTTPERTALKEALKARGVKVVRWMEERDAHIRPVVFPPNWKEMTASSCYGPSVLLSFEGL